jgi:hypothetical protein
MSPVRKTLVAVALAAGAVSTERVSFARQPTSGVFFAEDWESGVLTRSFNSRSYGSASGSQFSVQSTSPALGSGSLRHTLTAGLGPGAIQYATQHLGDAVSGPVHQAGQGQHFMDLYVQYKVRYSSSFDLATVPKQLIIGTEDDRRHDNVCCNPWVSHYLTVYPPHTARNTLVAEANNKQAPSGQWVGMVQNRNGYGAGNLFVTQHDRWYTVEVRRRLNDPGQDNGVFQMWVDGVLLSEHASVRYRVPWTGTYGAAEAFGTNFVMISDYLNNGSSRDQSIFYDDVKVSTSRIGVGSSLPAAPTNLRIIPGPDPFWR